MRALELAAADFDLSGIGVCWLGMGSEGRSEQTIATDQDNGIIFAADEPAPSDADIRDRLLPFAREINATLDRCGYPLCKGGVMAMNPQWCLSLPEWSADFAQWIDRGGPDSLLAANIFFDFRSLWGRADLAQALREDIAVRARANRRFLKQMSDNALRNRPPLSWRGELKTAEDASGTEGIDLKMSGSMPLTDGARIIRAGHGCCRNRHGRSPAAGRQPDGHRPMATSEAGATRSTTCNCCGCAHSTGALRETCLPRPIRTCFRCPACPTSTCES